MTDAITSARAKLSEALEPGLDLIEDRVRSTLDDVRRLVGLLIDADLVDGHPKFDRVPRHETREIPRSILEGSSLISSTRELRQAGAKLLGRLDSLVDEHEYRTVGDPADPELPMVVYGCFKPGELAWRLIEEHCDADEVELHDFRLRRRDGLAILERWSDQTVEAVVLRPRTGRHDKLYNIVGGFEPTDQYAWDIVEVTGVGPANVLVGKEPDHASEHEPLDGSWSSADDPVFNDGMKTVARLHPPVVGGQPRGGLFQLQAAYLLLWSVVERYSALRYSPSLNSMARVRRLDADADFTRAARAATRWRFEPVFDSRDPAQRYEIGDDGVGAATYWYALRSNLSHRGKSSGSDEARLDHSTQALFSVMRQLLSGQFPEDRDRWHDSHYKRTSAPRGQRLGHP